MGFGVFLLLVSYGGQTIISQYYNDIMAWRDESEQLYQITHSQNYRSVMEALKKISPYAEQIANTIGAIPFLSGLAEPLRLIPNSADLMDRIYTASEKIYYAISVIAITPQLLTYGLWLSLIFIALGIALVWRAHGKEHKLIQEAMLKKEKAAKPIPSTTIVKVKCSQCGGLNDETAKFCNHCGAKLKSE